MVQVDFLSKGRARRIELIEVLGNVKTKSLGVKIYRGDFRNLNTWKILQLLKQGSCIFWFILLAGAGYQQYYEEKVYKLNNRYLPY